MSYFSRLKTERERLGYSQPALATLTGVGKTTVINWEKGASAPDAVQLGAMATAGVDVLYVVTGQYAGGAKPAPSLSADEEELLALFRAAPLAVKAAAIGALHGGAGHPSGRPPARGGVKVSGSVGGDVLGSGAVKASGSVVQHNTGGGSVQVVSGAGNVTVNRRRVK